MAQIGKPIWFQGVFIRPQHFQQQDRYYEEFVNDYISAQFGYGWGLRRLEIDETALTLGKFQIAAISAILPDGTPLSAPGNAVLPPSRNFDDNASGKRVALALPIRRTDVPEVSMNDEISMNETDLEPRRLTKFSVSIRDISSEKEDYNDIDIGHLAPLLLLEGEDMDAYTTLPIARIESASDEGIELDKGYLPPVLNCITHPGYMRSLSHISAILQRRAKALSKQIDPVTATGLSDMLDFLLLQMVNRYQASLSHLTQLEHLLPERAYHAIAELYGEVGTFLPERRVEAPPPYDHNDPGPGWNKLVEAITTAFARISDRHGVELPLERQPNGSHVAAIHDRNLLDTARFILLLRLNSPRDIVQTQIENRLKISSVESLREIVNLQLSGVPCKILAMAPRGLPYYPDATYLEIDTTAPLWQEVRDTASVAVYLAWTDSLYTLQLWTVRSSETTQLPVAQEGMR